MRLCVCSLRLASLEINSEDKHACIYLPLCDISFACTYVPTCRVLSLLKSIDPCLFLAEVAENKKYQRREKVSILQSLCTTVAFHLMMASWLGHAQVTFYSSPSSISLPCKTSSPSDASGSHPSSISLRQLCEESTPPCRLNPFLLNGHIQTIYTALDKGDPPVFYKRHVFTHENPTFAGQFAVDFAVKPFPDEKRDPELPPRTAYYTQADFAEIGALDSRPMVVVLHGLAGGSNEVYLRSVLRLLVSENDVPDAEDWEACVVNSRGCAQSKITTGVLYNARATWDVRQTVKWLRTTFPNRPLFGLGFSLGANMMVNVRTVHSPIQALHILALNSILIVCRSFVICL